MFGHRKTTGEAGDKSQILADKLTHCPKCHSTDLQIDRFGDGTGTSALSAASVGRVGAASYRTPSISPLPPVDFEPENIIGHKTHVSCTQCGYKYWVKNKN